MSVTAGQTTASINFTLELGGSVSGKVTRADGTTPIADAWVSACPISSGVCTSVKSGPDGVYAIPGVALGAHRVSADARTQGYVFQYYNGKATYSTADPVTVTAGQATSNINFALALGGVISGKVFKADGTTPIEKAQVRVEDADGAFCCTWATSESDGSYTIKGLATGNHKVRADALGQGYPAKYYNNKNTVSAADLVAVTAPNETANINFSLDVGGVISGKVFKADGTTPIANAQVVASNFDGSCCGRSAYTAADGSYTITSLASGDYRIHADARSQGYILEYYNNKASSGPADPVTVTAGQTTANIIFTLDLGGSISGKVSKADGTTPIADAWVSACPVASGVCTSAKSAADGTYAIVGVAPGSHRVSADARNLGYVYEYHNNKATYSTADPVTVTAGQTTANINFALDLGGVISGKVFKADGTTPIANAQVRAESADGTFCCTWSVSGTDGAYSIKGLPTGDHKVQADALGQGYPAKYYNNKTTVSAADLVAVTAPNETTNINFTLDVGGTVTGKVTKADGTTPLVGVTVRACLPLSIPGLPPGICEATVSATTASDGTYAIVGLSSGAYRIYVDARSLGYVYEYYNNKATSATADLVTVTAGQTSADINFNLDVGGTIKGKVFKADETTPIAGASVTACPSAPGVCASASTGSDGGYVIRGVVPGYTRVSADARSQGYVTEYYSNKLLAPYADLVMVTADGTTTGIDFTLDLGGKITGKVTQADGTTPVFGAWVAACLLDGGRSCSGVATAVDGSYNLGPLAAGSYGVYANARTQGYVFQYYNNKPSIHTADPVTVDLGQTTSNINLFLTAGGTIAGKVTKADGVTPLADVSVVARAFPPNTGAIGATTGSDGDYAIKGLGTGNYKVSADGRSQGYLQEYYNGTLTFGAASTVAVSAPDTVSGIDIALDATQSSADLSVTSSVSPNPAVKDAPATYTVKVQNLGPDPASGVTLLDTFGAGVTLVSATPAQGNCTTLVGAVICDLGTVARDATVVTTVVVAPTITGLISNTGSVSSAVPDPVSTNNSVGFDTIVNSTAPPSPLVKVYSTSMGPGETRTVDILAGRIPPTGLASYQATLTYDPAVLRVDDVLAGDAPFDSLPQYAPVPPAGSVNIAGVVAQGPNGGNVVLARLKLTALGSLGSQSPLDLTVSELLDNSLNEITPRDVVDGTVTIGPNVAQSIGQALETVDGKKKVWVTLRAEGGVLGGQAATLAGGIRHAEARLTYAPSCMTVLAVKSTAPFTTSLATMPPGASMIALFVDIPAGVDAAQPPVEFGRLLVRLTGSSASPCPLTLWESSSYRPGTGAQDPTWSGSGATVKQYRRGDARGTGTVTSVTQAIQMLRFLVAPDSNAALANINALNAASVKSDAPSSGTDNGDNISTADAILILRRIVKIVDDLFRACTLPEATCGAPPTPTPTPGP